MSGNSTRLGVGLALGEWDQAAIAFGLIALFVVGVVAGATVARRFGEERRSAVLAVEAVLLLIGAGLCTAGWRELGMVAVVMAMGVENAVFQRQGDVGGRPDLYDRGRWCGWASGSRPPCTAARVGTGSRS
jgi:uncharacterized membrane protein YoaK (UPF0700 family)